MALLSSPMPLDYRSPLGLHLVQGSRPVWVFQNTIWKVALELHESEGLPAFSFRYLHGESLGMSIWMGAVSLGLGREAPDVRRNRCGSIIASKFRYYIKANNHYGKSERLLIRGYSIPDFVRFSQFYPEWYLSRQQGQVPIKLFENKMPLPRLKAFDRNVPALDGLRAV